MDEHIDYENIFTPQGMLGQVSKKPNLDFLMNIFNIPRVYSVSGFGTSRLPLPAGKNKHNRTGANDERGDDARHNHGLLPVSSDVD